MPAWSPDGKKMAFVSDRNGNTDIFIYDFASQQTTQITDNLGGDEFPAWSPDGKQILYVSYQNGQWDVFSMNADGTNPVNLTNDPIQEWRPAFRP